MASFLSELRREWNAWKQLNRRAVWIALWTPVALAVQEYWFLPVRTLERYRWTHFVLPGSRDALGFYFWWVGGLLATGVFLPALALRVFAGVRPRQLGWQWSGSATDRRLYATLFLLMLPVIWFASQQTAFRQTYPMFRAAGGPFSAESIAFELVYCLQFLAVEFFYRGILVVGLKPLIGRYAVLLALTPYCLLHFHKPFLEALGAIVAGAVLGTLAYRSETILYGWALHYAIALTMDCLAWRG